jgi:hypothetical protein
MTPVMKLNTILLIRRVDHTNCTISNPSHIVLPSNGSNSWTSSRLSFTAMDLTMMVQHTSMHVTCSSLEGKALHVFNDKAAEQKE